MSARAAERLVHVYRNRPDDDRGPDRLHFCSPCNGWYGVPHTGTSKCHSRLLAAPFAGPNCACAHCRLKHGKTVEGAFGFLTDAPEWMPS